MHISPQCRYVILGYSRSGTTLTHLALMGHPGIAALVGELRPSPFYSQGITTFTGGYCTEKEKEAGFRAIFDAITTVHADEKTVAIGAKTACNSARNAKEIVNVLQNYIPDARVIHVVRKDLAAQYGSAISAKKSGVFHSWGKGHQNRKIHTIRLNKWTFIDYIIANLKMYNVFKELRKTHSVFELQYEEYCRDPDKMHKELFHFLDVADIDVTWLQSEKVLPSPEEYIENYHDMQKVLSRIETQFFDDAIPNHVVYAAKAVTRLGSIFRIGRRRKQGK